MKSNDKIVTGIEMKFKVRAIQSDAPGLYYLEDDEKTHIGLLVIKDGEPSYIILSKKQAKALADEFRDIYKLRFE